MARLQMGGPAGTLDQSNPAPAKTASPPYWRAIWKTIFTTRHSRKHQWNRPPGAVATLADNLAARQHPLKHAVFGDQQMM